MSVRRAYDTDLSDEEWPKLKPLVPVAKPGGRLRTHEPRELLNAVLYAQGRVVTRRNYLRRPTSRSTRLHFLIEFSVERPLALLAAPLRDDRPEHGGV